MARTTTAMVQLAGGYADLVCCVRTVKNCSCHRASNPELFAATIGGLGLTGLITWVELELTAIDSAMIDAETIPFEDLNAFLLFPKKARNASIIRSLGSIAWLRGHLSGAVCFRAVTMPWLVRDFWIVETRAFLCRSTFRV